MRPVLNSYKANVRKAFIYDAEFESGELQSRTTKIRFDQPDKLSTLVDVNTLEDGYYSNKHDLHLNCIQMEERIGPLQEKPYLTNSDIMIVCSRLND